MQEDVEGVQKSKHNKRKQAPVGAEEEAKEAQQKAGGAANLARQALAEAQKAKNDANKASEDAEKEEQGPVKNEAAATGDPHLSTALGGHRELCCSGSVCKACPYPAALVQENEDSAEIKKHKGKQTPATAEAKEAEQEAQGALSKAREALKEAREAETEAKKASSDADEENSKAAISDQAEATGDPHLTLANGNKEDLCCHDGHCKRC